VRGMIARLERAEVKPAACFVGEPTEMGVVIAPPRGSRRRSPSCRSRRGRRGGRRARSGGTDRSTTTVLRPGPRRCAPTGWCRARRMGRSSPTHWPCCRSYRARAHAPRRVGRDRLRPIRPMRGSICGSWYRSRPGLRALRWLVARASFIRINLFKPHCTRQDVRKPQDQGARSAAVRALRDPAPPARWPRWGFGSAARRRHQPNGGGAGSASECLNITTPLDLFQTARRPRREG
jgi:hypothetical protein